MRVFARENLGMVSRVIRGCFRRSERKWRRAENSMATAAKFATNELLASAPAFAERHYSPAEIAESPITLSPLAAVLFVAKLRQMIDCDARLPRRGQQTTGQKGASMARSRYQQGTIMLRGKRRRVWVLRWR